MTNVRSLLATFKMANESCRISGNIRRVSHVEPIFPSLRCGHYRSSHDSWFMCLQHVFIFNPQPLGGPFLSLSARASCSAFSFRFIITSQLYTRAVATSIVYRGTLVTVSIHGGYHIPLFVLVKSPDLLHNLPDSPLQPRASNPTTLAPHLLDMIT
jgi:hypothetical protein